MAFDELKPFPMPEKIVTAEVEGDTRVPYERIKSYDAKEFELFIREWVVFLSDKYQVRGFGGAGDMGRDVVAKDSEGNYYYYQCKHYDKPLTPGVMMPEFGKLVYYTFNNIVPHPKEYYIVAPCDIGPQLNNLIENPSCINGKIIDKWEGLSKDIAANAPKVLSDKLKEYILEFDFSIIKTKSMLEIIAEHQKTAFYAFRFGGGLTVKRNRQINVPSVAGENETIYIRKILDAISEKENAKIRSIEQLESEFPQYIQWFKVQRERFYSAENLKLFALRNLLSNKYFEDLTEDVYYGVVDFLEKAYNNGFERVTDVMSQAARLELRQNLLSKYDLVHVQDRQGICHQIANERDDFIWTNEK